MSNHDDDGAQPLYYKIDTEKFQRRTPCADYEEFNQTSDVIIGDGLHRFVIAFNHTVPGPTLVVYRNSTIIVHVTNKADEPISVHWHGLEMRGAFFMDGVGMVSQCPIMTGQKFTYKFQVSKFLESYSRTSRVYCSDNRSSRNLLVPRSYGCEYWRRVIRCFNSGG